MTWKERLLPISLIQMLRAQQNYLCDQAADEIERLAHELARLHKRLEELAPDETIVMKHTGIKT